MVERRKVALLRAESLPIRADDAHDVGADTAGVILSETPHLADEMTLIVDVGTNAEIVLGNRHRLLAASSPTGPAFEGAQISCGQRAAPGAIERVRIDPVTLEPRFKVIGSELWSNEPGFAEETKKIGVTGICGSGIIEVLAEMYLAGILAQDGTIDGAAAARSPNPASARPSAIGASSFGYSCGSYSRSASWTMTTSPVAAANPVRSAAPLPWLRSWYNTRTLAGKVVFCRSSRVPSLEQSSTRMRSFSTATS